MQLLGRTSRMPNSNACKMTGLLLVSLCGQVSITLANPRRLLGRPHHPISESWICVGSPRIDITCIEVTGAQTLRPCTFCHTGIGPTALASPCPFLFIPMAIQRSCFSMAGRWVRGLKIKSPTGQKESHRTMIQHTHTAYVGTR